MLSRTLLILGMISNALVFPHGLCAQTFARAANCATNDVDGHQYATLSLCAIDPQTGQAGATATGQVPFVARTVPWVRAGAGAVCTQGSAASEFGARGLALLAKGVEPTVVLERLLASDESRESGHMGIVDMQGRTAAHTGEKNGAWAGSRQGRYYTVQASLMVEPQVLNAVAASFESTEGDGMPLAERMILAMEAGLAKYEDRCWGNMQSAGIRIADPDDPGRGNDHIALAIDVGEHPDPVGETKRIYMTTARRLGYRAFSRIQGPDVIELKRMLHALGYWRPSLAAFPETPPPPNSQRLQAVRENDRGAYDKLVAEVNRLWAEYARDLAPFDTEAAEAVDRFRRDNNLNYEGNSPGLVDARLIKALRAAYYDNRKAGGARQ